MASNSDRKRWAQRKRESQAPKLFQRFLSIRAEEVKDNRVRLVAATESPVDVGGFKEVLRCGPGCVDSSAARSLLLNHNARALIGGVLSVECKEGRVEAEVEIDQNAKTETGVNVLDAVRKGYLRGVSVGYDYNWQNTVRTTDEKDTTTVEVNRWELREITLTPIPADTAASVRSLPPSDRAGAGEEAQQRGKESRAMPETTTQAPDPKIAERENELKKEREARELAERKLSNRELSDKFDFDKANLDFGMEPGAFKDECLKRMAQKNATKPVENVTVTRDAADKADEAAVDGVLDMGGIRKGNDQGMRGLSILDLGRRWLAARNVRTDHLSKMQLAKMLIGRGEQGQREATVHLADFATYVLVNAMDKAVFEAFSGYEKETNWKVWTKQREVMDFKTFYGAGVSSGNLTQTAEGVPFPELSKGDGGYSGALDMWGAVVSLTLPALINDDLGQFMALLGRAGAIAQRTIDKQVYTALAAASWTNRTFATADLAEATFDKAKRLLKATAGAEADAEKLLVTGKYLIVPDGLDTTARRLVALSSENVVPSSRYFNQGVSVVTSAFLTTATTTAQSTWYLVGDQVFEACVVAFLRGMTTPQIEEFDAGAVAARKWKIMLPFKVVVTPTYGAYQGTHA